MPLHFFDLPRELRDQIYALAVTRDTENWSSVLLVNHQFGCEAHAAFLALHCLISISLPGAESDQMGFFMALTVPARDNLGMKPSHPGVVASADKVASRIYKPTLSIEIKTAKIGQNWSSFYMILDLDPPDSLLELCKLISNYQNKRYYLYGESWDLQYNIKLQSYSAKESDLLSPFQQIWQDPASMSLQNISFQGFTDSALVSATTKIMTCYWTGNPWLGRLQDSMAARLEAMRTTQDMSIMSTLCEALTSEIKDVYDIICEGHIDVGGRPILTFGLEKLAIRWQGDAMQAVNHHLLRSFFHENPNGAGIELKHAQELAHAAIAIYSIIARHGYHWMFEVVHRSCVGQEHDVPTGPTRGVPNTALYLYVHAIAYAILCEKSQTETCIGRYRLYYPEGGVAHDKKRANLEIFMHVQERAGMMHRALTSKLWWKSMFLRGKGKLAKDKLPSLYGYGGAI